MQDNESQWLTRAQKGDSQSFAHLVEKYQRPVYNMCYRMLNNAEDAEDAAQETFLRAFKSIKRYDKNRPFATWLLSIAAHYCIDRIRKQRMKIVSMEDLPHVHIHDDSPGPESIMSRSEEQDRVRKLLDSLSPTDRAAVVMYYWYDFSYDEIASSLSLSLSAVKSRLHRARRSMAKKWQDQSAQLIPAERRRHGERSPAF